MSARSRGALAGSMLATAVCLGAGAFGASPAFAEDPTAMEEVLGILRKEGVIDQATEERVLAKHVSEQKKAADDAAGLLGGLEWYGDLRLRFDGTKYDTDALNVNRDDRNRFRFRARFGFKKQVNDRLQIGLRLASGGGDNDSTNQTFGGSADFAGDDIFIDRAWADLALVEQDDVSVHLVAGRVANPYVWKNGKDFLVWDGDVNLEGAYVGSTFSLADETQLFVTAGSYIAREVNRGSDPKIIGGQVGLTTSAGGLGFGIRTSLYDYRSLDDGPGSFLAAAAGDGNLLGVTDANGKVLQDGGAFDDGRARVGDVTAFVNLGLSDDLPIVFYGTYLRNFEADSFTFVGPSGAISVDDEDTAWGIGFEIGDKKKNVKLGLGYFHVEANAVVAQFTDSDLFEGITNREGFIVYASRQIAKNVDLGLTFFSGDDIESDGRGDGPFVQSIRDADRLRLQADVQMKF